MCFPPYEGCPNHPTAFCAKKHASMLVMSVVSELYHTGERHKYNQGKRTRGKKNNNKKRQWKTFLLTSGQHGEARSGGSSLAEDSDLGQLMGIAHVSPA